MVKLSPNVMEPANGVDENARVFRNGIGDPRVGELQEQRATGPEKEYGFACHAPGHRSRTKQPGPRLTDALKLFDLTFEVGTGDEYLLRK
jgi:hypothetical protein